MGGGRNDLLPMWKKHKTNAELSRGISPRYAKQFGIAGRANVDFERHNQHESQKPGANAAYIPDEEAIQLACRELQSKWTDAEVESRKYPLLATSLGWPGPFCCECGRPIVDESCERTDLICGRCFGFAKIIAPLRSRRNNPQVERSEIEFHGGNNNHFDQDYWLFQIGG